MDILHPAGFIETGGCQGPRLVRNQPSRESPGVILNEVTDKYVTGFNLPIRNSIRILKQLKFNWNKLSDTDKENVMEILKNDKLFKDKGLDSLFETYRQREFKQAIPTNGLLMSLNNLEEPPKKEDVNKALDALLTDDSTKNYATEYMVQRYWFIFLIIFFLLILVLGLSIGLGKK
jgi:lipopolysaccharide export LptBFGC system permease protein LptF